MIRTRLNRHPNDTLTRFASCSKPDILRRTLGAKADRQAAIPSYLNSIDPEPLAGSEANARTSIRASKSEDLG